MDSEAIADVDPAFTERIVGTVVGDHAVGTIVDRVFELVFDGKLANRRSAILTDSDAVLPDELSAAENCELVFAEINDGIKRAVDDLQFLADADFAGIHLVQPREILPGKFVLLGDLAQLIARLNDIRLFIMWLWRKIDRLGQSFHRLLKSRTVLRMVPIPSGEPFVSGLLLTVFDQLIDFQKVFRRDRTVGCRRLNSGFGSGHCDDR